MNEYRHQGQEGLTCKHVCGIPMHPRARTSRGAHSPWQLPSVPVARMQPCSPHNADRSMCSSAWHHTQVLCAGSGDMQPPALQHLQGSSCTCLRRRTCSSQSARWTVMRSLNWESLRGMCAPPATSGRALMLCWPGLSESVASRVVRSMTQLQKAQNSARCAHVRRRKSVRPQVCV